MDIRNPGNVSPPETEDIAEHQKSETFEELNYSGISSHEEEHLKVDFSQKAQKSRFLDVMMHHFVKKA